RRAPRRRGSGGAGGAAGRGARGHRARWHAHQRPARHHLHPRRHGARGREAARDSTTHRRTGMKRFALAAALVIIGFSVTAQQFDLTIDNIMRGNGLVGWEPDELRWSPDGAHIYFGWKQYNEPLEKDRDTYVTHRDGSGLRKLSDEEKKDAPPANAQWTRDRMRAVFADDGDIFLWADGKRRALTQTNDAESGPQWTFDEKRVTFIHANNVYEIN